MKKEKMLEFKRKVAVVLTVAMVLPSNYMVKADDTVQVVRTQVSSSYATSNASENGGGQVGLFQAVTHRAIMHLGILRLYRQQIRRKEMKMHLVLMQVKS